MSSIRIAAPSRLHSSVLINLKNPNWSLVSMHSIADSLARLARFNGHITPYRSADENDPLAIYTVAQHAVLCAAFTYRSGYDSDVIRAALMHDDTEALTGDIVSPVKGMFPELQDYCASLEASYSEYHMLNLIYGGKTALAVKRVDYLIYQYESRHLFGKREDTTIPPTDMAMMETFVVWPPEVARFAYLSARKLWSGVDISGEVVQAHKLIDIVTHANAEALRKGRL